MSAGKHWHGDCFKCKSCNIDIGTSTFVPREDGIFCRACYETKFAKRCVTCKEIIHDEGVEYKSRTWHKECFVCTSCQSELEKFLSRDEHVYCLKCWSEKIAKKCTGCGSAIMGGKGARFVSFEVSCILIFQPLTSNVPKININTSSSLFNKLSVSQLNCCRTARGISLVSRVRSAIFPWLEPVS